MNIAIMQPYFLPYIGYFQLINHVDKFVIYDEIQFTKKGWIQRNRMLMNNKDFMFSLSLKKDSDYLNIIDRQLFFQHNLNMHRFYSSNSLRIHVSKICNVSTKIVNV